MKKGILIVCAMFCVVTSANMARAIPVQWGSTGHYYDVISFSGTWNEAKLHAETQQFMGMQGHLVTLTSAAENIFLSTNVYIGSRAWIGAYQTSYDNEPAGNWEWVTGEAWEYTNWAFGEPNNWHLIEHYAEMIPWSSTGDGRAWNDRGNVDVWEMVYYYVEYEPGAVIPEPTTILLVGTGLIGLLVLRRKGSHKR